MTRPKMLVRHMLLRMKRLAGKNKTKPPMPAPQESVDNTTPVEAPAPQPADCHLLKLPTELRIIIYELVLCDFDPPPTKQRNYLNARIASAPLIQTNRLIRQESIEFYCKRLRDLAVELRKAQIIAYMYLFFHIQTTKACFRLHYYDQGLNFSEALVTRMDAMGIMSTYMSKMRIGITNKVGDLAAQGYETGLHSLKLGDIEEVMADFEGELKEMMGVGRRVDANSSN